MSLWNLQDTVLSSTEPKLRPEITRRMRLRFAIQEESRPSVSFTEEVRENDSSLTQFWSLSSFESSLPVITPAKDKNVMAVIREKPF